MYAIRSYYDPLLSFVHEALARLGVMTVKFNFPYKERGGKAPDRTPLLEATWRAVIGAVRADEQLAPARLFCGGKSMGGRIASQLVADGEACAGRITSYNVCYTKLLRLSMELMMTLRFMKSQATIGAAAKSI